MLIDFFKKNKELLRLSDRKTCIRALLMGSFGLELFIEIISRASLLDTLKYIVTKPAVFLINTMIIMSVISLFVLFKRRLFALTLLSMLWIIIGVTNGILLIFRTTPFTAQDLLLIKYALGMSTDYLGILGIILLILCVAAVIFFAVVLYRKIPVIDRKINYARNIIFVLGIIFSSLLLNELMVFTGLIETNFGNIHDAYEKYGVAYCFANTLLNTGIKEPEDYDDNLVDDSDIKEAINPGESNDENEQSTVDDYNIPDESSSEGINEDNSNDADNDTDDTSAEEMPNIIVVQLESFFDISQIKGLELSEDPISYFHYLSDNFSSGYLSMPSVGAGTANSEFEVITGMNIDSFGPGEYPYKTVLKNSTCESAAYNLENLGYKSYAIHNNEGTFYDRHTVYPKLGFSCFVPIEYMYDLTYTETGWAEDKCLTEYIKNIIDIEDNPSFIYTVSVQGHGAYPSEAIIDNPVIDIISIPNAEQYESYRYYVNQLYEMDWFIKNLVEALTKSGERCILVLFGDHLPGLELDNDMLDDGDIYLTNYVVWDNIGLEKNDYNLEAYQLMASVCDRLDIHEGILCRFHQMFLNGEINEIDYLKKLDSIEYDMLYGDQLVFDGVNPYLEKEMKFGIFPISISEITYKNGYLYVTGDNFNEYSVVTVDDKQIDTIFISSHLLVASMEKTPDEISVSVSQIGRDHVVLGTTEIKEYRYKKRPDVPNAGVYE